MQVKNITYKVDDAKLITVSGAIVLCVTIAI